MHNPGDPDCPCEYCQQERTEYANAEQPEDYEAQSAAFEAHKEQCLEKFGWYTVIYPRYSNGSDTFAMRTYGLPDMYGHLDLQLVAPISREAANQLMWDLVARIAKGTLMVGKPVVGLLGKGYPIKLMEVVDGFETLLRVILPDHRGRLDRCVMDGPWDQQYSDLEN